MTSVGIIGVGVIRSDEHIELPKRSFLSFLNRKTQSEPTVVQLANAAALRALAQADILADEVDLILGTSTAFTNFSPGSTQLAPRLSWGVHQLLNIKNTFAYDVCTPDGLLSIETAMIHIQSGRGKVALVVTAEQFLKDFIDVDNSDQVPLLTGAAASVIGEGRRGLNLIASSYGCANISETWLGLDLVYGEQAPYRPKVSFCQVKKDESATAMAVSAVRQFEKCLDKAGISADDIHHYLLPRWSKLFRIRLWEALNLITDDWDDGIEDGFLFSPGAMMELAQRTEEMQFGERFALFGYGLGGHVGCHIYQVLG